MSNREILNFKPYRTLTYWSKNIDIFITINNLSKFLSFFGYDYDENKYEKVGTLCYQYYQEHHDIKFVFKRLIDAIDRCDLRYEAIKSLHHNPIMKMFKAARKWMRELKSTN